MCDMRYTPLPPPPLPLGQRQLNERYDPHDSKNIVRLLDCFLFQNHLCLVFELLSINLYELLKQNQFRGLPLSLIRHFIKQILEVGAIHAQSLYKNFSITITIDSILVV